MLLLLYCLENYITTRCLCQRQNACFKGKTAVFTLKISQRLKKSSKILIKPENFAKIVTDKQKTGDITMKKSEISILAGLVLALFISFFADTVSRADSIRAGTLRLHVIANSDSRADQRIKMQVKDTVSRLRNDICAGARDYRQAVDKTRDNLDLLQQRANRKLGQLGADYTASCSVENFYFDTTEYENFTMPRGEYKALTVRLGRAEGKNWWCVVYPGLCASASAKYEDEADNTFVETDNFRIKFKAVEIYQDFISLFDEKAEK